jgi:hypothetical protein
LSHRSQPNQPDGVITPITIGPAPRARSKSAELLRAAEYVAGRNRHADRLSVVLPLRYVSDREKPDEAPRMIGMTNGDSHQLVAVLLWFELTISARVELGQRPSVKAH